MVCDRCGSSGRDSSETGRSTLKSTDVTELLGRWHAGDDSVVDRLFSEIEPTLRRLARSQLSRDRLSASIEPTELVSEAALKILDARGVGFSGRAQFFSFAGRLMRRVLVDEARKLAAQKRPVNQVTVAVDSMADDREISLLDLDDALEDLARVDAGLSDILNLKFFCGLSYEEIAEVCGLSTATVKRKWTVARAWLHNHLARPTR